MNNLRKTNFTTSIWAIQQRNWAWPQSGLASPAKQKSAIQKSLLEDIFCD